MKRSWLKKGIIALSLILLVFFVLSLKEGHAQEMIPIPRIGITLDEAREPRDVALSLEILFLLTVLSLAQQS